MICAERNETCCPLPLAALLCGSSLQTIPSAQDLRTCKNPTCSLLDTVGAFSSSSRCCFSSKLALRCVSRRNRGFVELLAVRNNLPQASSAMYQPAPAADENQLQLSAICKNYFDKWDDPKNSLYMGLPQYRQSRRMRRTNCGPKFSSPPPRQLELPCTHRSVSLTEPIPRLADRHRASWALGAFIEALTDVL